MPTRHDQIKYLVSVGAIKPLCDLLTCSDPRIVTVALEGIENILKARTRGTAFEWTASKALPVLLQSQRIGAREDCPLPTLAGELSAASCARSLSWVA